MLDDGALVSNSLVQSVQNLSKDILPTDLNVRRKNQVAVGLEIGSRATAQQDTVTYPEASVTLAEPNKKFASVVNNPQDWFKNSKCSAAL